MVIEELETHKDKVEAGVEYLRTRIPYIPEYGVILGTGLGSIVESIEDSLTIPYSDIPGFPSVPTVVSHAGNLVFGKLGKSPIVILQGRFHYYEGYSTRELTIPVRVLGLLGIKKLIVTNAAGGLNPEFYAGNIMMIKDHINLINDNPLRGPNIDEWGPRFPDMSQVYDKSLMELCRKGASDLGLKNIAEGIYCAVPGPSLETPAETRYLQQCGGDAVGMSTVPEVIVARHCGMDVLGLSVIANENDPDDFKPIVVDDILESMERAAADLGGLIQRVVDSE